MNDQIGFVSESIDALVKDPNKKSLLKRVFRDKLKKLPRGTAQWEEVVRTVNKLLFTLFLEDRKSHSDAEI